jgi:16S rRNA (adenine1518-N6/adenine1519-N6)-dimethyltransferase
VTRVVAALDASAADAFVEIGPGRGAITRPLAARVARLLAIEVDRDLAAALRAESLPGVTVVVGDVLALDLAGAIGGWLGAPCGPDRTVRVAGNLPYNISSPILFRLLALATATSGVTDATLMLQREVADRLVARPGSREYGVLTILTALHADVTRVLALPPGAFRPAPRVSSAVVRLRFRPPEVKVPDEAVFTGMVRAMFTQRRKTVGNALRGFAAAAGLNPVWALHEAGIETGRRPETLQLVELARLAEIFASGRHPGVL